MIEIDHTGYLFKNIFYFYRCEGLDILNSMSRWKNKTITHINTIHKPHMERLLRKYRVATSIFNLMLYLLFKTENNR